MNPTSAEGDKRTRRIKDGQDDQSERIIGNREQQEERNGWMGRRKDEARDHRRERDVRRAGNRPSAKQFGRPAGQAKAR